LEDRILFEDNHLIVINKKAGELVQGDNTGDMSLLDSVKAFLKSKYNKPGAAFLGLVHRLDRPTSGVILFAKTSKALTRLNKQFRLRIPKKTYWAIVSKKHIDQKGSLIHWMTRNTNQNKSKAHSKKVLNGKLAKLNYISLKSFDHYRLLEVNLETGRHHQIRAQLSAINFPIQGDLKYGASRSNRDGSISLHARSLEIDHPITKETIVFKANPQKVGIWKAVLSD
jgi:23S rRNA pseudouridine1911/1915/1917 synthase